MAGNEAPKEEELISERAKKIKSWIGRPGNLIIILILLGSLILRIYFINISSGKALWWDEAEYMATAKYWALDVPYVLNPQRPPLFQLLAALLIMLGFGEYALKVILVALPATLLIFFTYLLGNELFSKKIGIFAAGASAVMWSYLFWGARFQPDFLSVSFQVLSLFFFWKLFKAPERKSAILAGAFAAFGFYFKISALLVPLSVFIFALYKDGFSFIKKKEYWISLLSFILVLIPFMAWQYYLFGNPLAFSTSYGLEGGSSERPLGWQALEFYHLFPKFFLSIFFLAGLLLIISRFFISFDLILKDSKRRSSPEIFSLIILLTVSIFYIFYIQGVIEDRWVFLAAPLIFIISGLGLFWILGVLGIKSQYIQAFIVLIILIFFIMAQVGHAGALIKGKTGSYLPVKEAALWIKGNTEKDDRIISASYTQATAYSEREVLIFSKCPWVCPQYQESEFDKMLLEKKPKYLMLSIFEGHPRWAFEVQSYPNGQFQSLRSQYLNSSLAFSQQGQVNYADWKNSVNRSGMELKLVYPPQGLNGVFVYEIIYNENNIPQ